MAENSDWTGPPAAVPERTTPAALASYVSGVTLASGDGPAWKDLFVQVFARQRAQSPVLVPAVAEPLIVWIMSGDVRVEEREPGGDWTANRVTAGDVFLTRSPTPYEMRWQAEDDQPFTVMQLYLSISLFEEVARQVTGSSGTVALRDVSGGRDPTLSHLLGLVHGELVNPDGADPLFVGGLAQSLTVHLVRRYAVSGPAARRPPALPGAKLRRAVADMQTHLDRPFDLKRLADTVGMSQFHFSRLFKKATGLPPSRFFIRLRIAEARRLLRETDVGVLDVGLAVGYASPSHFAQVFRRETGLSPSDYRGA